MLSLVHITKRFGALVANDDISLSLARGEVLALLGENGAGKSTLVSILFGHYRADEGAIEIDGAPLPPGEPAAALAAGIGMVHQHFTLADNLSVLDNVTIGTEPLWRPAARRGAARRKLVDKAARFGLAVDPDARVATLSVGERQRVEILKALYRGARVLILDEPTAVLTPQESESLFATLKQFVREGLAVIFISHKLDEVLAVADRIAVLRAGRLVAERAAAQTTKAELAALMVGRELAPPPARSERAPGARVLELTDVANGGHGRAALQGATLSVHGGEIVAVAGVAGNGQGALAQLLFGLARPVRGRIALHGADYPATPRALAAAGVARVPEDRRREGSVGEFSLAENGALERLRTPRFTRAGLLRRGEMRRFGAQLAADYDVRGGALGAPVRLLSGGNLQKLILGRALSAMAPAGRPRLIVVDQPTWGLDVGAVAAIHARLLAAREAGDAVLLISEDLDEIFALADRIAVINHGRIVETRAAREWTLAELGLAMAERRAA
ncbi:MAG: ABC transporter ATP-binding protein [Betaproteobacteria bacterium]